MFSWRYPPDRSTFDIVMLFSCHVAIAVSATAVLVDALR
jgi:hypothetical protein